MEENIGTGRIGAETDETPPIIISLDRIKGQWLVNGSEYLYFISEQSHLTHQEQVEGFLHGDEVDLTHNEDEGHGH